MREIKKKNKLFYEYNNGKHVIFTFCQTVIMNYFLNIGFKILVYGSLSEKELYMYDVLIYIM